MPVTCPCGQAFTVHDVAAPRRISCHTCGRKLIVVADGPHLAAHEIRALSVQVACPCGQPVTVHAEQFPMKVRCIKCGHRFSVLDTGDIVEPLPASRDRRDQETAEAIQDGRILTEPAAICTDATQEALREEAIDADRADLLRELKLIDSRWQADRERSALISVLGFTLVPSRSMSVALGAVMIAGGLLLAGLFALKARPDSRLAALIAMAFSMLIAALGLYVSKRLHRRAKMLEQEEAEWRRQRFAAIAKHDAALSAR